MPLLDVVAVALAAAGQPSRAASRLKAAGQWPPATLGGSLELMAQDGPGAVAHWRAEADRTLGCAKALDLTAIGPGDPTYPALLDAIPDPPLLLWVRGDTTALLGPAIAIVGSRHACSAGREIAFQIAADLAASGVVVASGFARGVDAAAHRGALSRGRSLAVLGCGVDQPYPSDHGALASQLAGAGAVVSEFAPGTPPRAHHFPLRNRTLSGLCRAVVVVQAAQRSGSLITARLALEQGRDVMAVPGDVRSGLNAGGHALLRDGARLVERAADVLDELGWTAPPASHGPADDRPGVDRSRVDRSGVDRPAVEGARVEAAGAALLATLVREGGASLDDLVGETGRSSADLLGELLDLELAGQLRRDAGGRFLPLERKW